MGTDELTVAASATCLYLLSYCTILQASGDSAHSPQGGGVASSPGVTGTFAERPSIPPAASGSKLSAPGQPEGGEVSTAEHPCPHTPQGYDHQLENNPRMWPSDPRAS